MNSERYKEIIDATIPQPKAGGYYARTFTPYLEYSKFVEYDDTVLSFLKEHKIARAMLAWRHAGHHGLSIWGIKGLTGLPFNKIKAFIDEQTERNCYQQYCSATGLPVYILHMRYRAKEPTPAEYVKTRDEVGPYKICDIFAQPLTYFFAARSEGTKHSEQATEVEEELLKTYHIADMNEEQLRLFDPFDKGCDISKERWAELKAFINHKEWEE